MLILHDHNTILNVGGDSCRRRRRCRLEGRYGMCGQLILASLWRTYREALRLSCGRMSVELNGPCRADAKRDVWHDDGRIKDEGKNCLLATFSWVIGITI